MLELRPGCECCDKDLPPQSAEAYICTFECTFCFDCSEGKFNYVCPNCGGNLVIRPNRPEHLLGKNPSSENRVYHPELSSHPFDKHN